MEPRIVIDILVELAQREQELTEAAASAARARRTVRDRAELAAEFDEDAALAAADADAADTVFRRREREIRDLEARIVDRKERRIGVSDRRQHRALGDEIAALERRIDKLENEAIAALEEADDHRGEAGNARGEAGRLEAASAAADPELTASIARAEACRAEVALEIERLVGMLPPDVGRHVARLRRRDGHAVALLGEGGACTGCFGLLPPQEAAAAQGGKQLVRCASCARYVVHQPWR